MPMNFIINGLHGVVVNDDWRKLGMKWIERVMRVCSDWTERDKMSKMAEYDYQIKLYLILISDQK